MEKDLVNIVIEKSYIELSAFERAELDEFCSSESEYNQLKDVFIEVEMMQFDRVSPRKETKESLDSLFDSTYPKVTPIWYMSAAAVIVPKEKPIHRQPLLQIAAVGLLFFFAYPFFQNEVNTDSSQVAVAQKHESIDHSVSFKNQPAVVKVVDEVTPEVVNEVVVTTRVLAAATPADLLDPNHSDGIFDPTTEIAFSQPASAQPEMLDLLTATF